MSDHVKRPDDDALGGVTHETFSPCVGDMFQVVFDEGVTYPLVLERAIVKAQRANDIHRRAPFSLFFTGPGPHVLQQGSYRMQHVKLGELNIFIVPVAETDGGFRYQAAFS